MKYIIVGKDGLSSALAYALKNEGNDVYFYKQKEEASDILKGYVNIIEDWEEIKDDVDCIIFEDTGFGTRADELKEEGYWVVGASSFCDKLETDREFGTEIAKKMDVSIPEVKSFSSFEEGKEFLDSKEGAGKRWVIKFNGVAGNIKDLLYISEMDDNKDLLKMFDFYSNHWKPEYGKVDFVLQEYIEGIELGITGFFNGECFIMPYYIDREYKRWLAGDLSVNTGQEGEVQYWIPKPTKFFKKTLYKLEDDLKKAKYVGVFNVNGILDSKGNYWFLEFTPRFGYNSQSIEIEVFKKNGYKALDWMKYDKMNIKELWAMGVLITVPPYPNSSPDLYLSVGKGLPLLKTPKEGFYPHDLEYKDEEWITGGVLGYVCSVCGVGDGLEEVRKEVYKRAEEIILPKKQYRIDIGEKNPFEGVKI